MDVAMNIGLCISSLVIASLFCSIVNLVSSDKAWIRTRIQKAIRFGDILLGLIALEIGGSMMLGTCQEAYSVGLYGLLYVVGISIGFLLLGFGFARKMKALNIESTVDLFQKQYQSNLLRFIASCLSIATTGGLLIGQIIAAKSLILAMGIHNEIVFALMGIGIILYTIWGGLRLAGITYRIQLIYTIIVFSLIFFLCIFKEPPSFFTNIIHTTLVQQAPVSISTVFASIVMPALYYITDQEFAQPLFAVSSKRTMILASICASLFMLLFSLVPIYFGIKARALNLTFSNSISPLIPLLQRMTVPSIVIASIIGMAAALTAMIDYYLWSIGLGIIAELSLNKNKHNKYWHYAIVCIVGIIALAGSYCTTSSAIQVLLCSYELYDSCLIVPVLMSYFQLNLKKGSAIGSIIAGLSSFIIFQTWPIEVPRQLISLAVSLCGFYVGGWCQKIVGHLQENTRLETPFLNKLLQKKNFPV